MEDDTKVISTNHIVRCMNHVMDTNGNPINYEILWINDTSFFVAVTVLLMPTTDEANTTSGVAGMGSQQQLMSPLYLEDLKIQERNMFHEHGQVALRALKHRFPLAKIESIEEIEYQTIMTKRLLESVGGHGEKVDMSGTSGGAEDNGKTSKKRRSFWNLWGLMSSSSSTKVGDDDEEGVQPSSKRRRIN